MREFAKSKIHSYNKMLKGIKLLKSFKIDIYL